MQYQLKPLSQLLVLTSSILFILYFDYIIFEEIYVFKDIGSDTLNHNLPSILDSVRYFHNDGIPFWSFSQGLGQDIFPGNLANPFNWVFFFLEETNIPYAIAYMEMLKILFVSVFIYFYLIEISIKKEIAILWSILLAFSGYVIVAGSWYRFSTEAVFASLLLLSLERYIQKREWRLIPIAFAFIGANVSFDLYLYGLFSILYITARTFSNINSLSVIIQRNIHFGFIAFLGIGISSIFLFKNIDMYIHSPRGTGGSGYFNSLFSLNVFEPISIKTAFTSIGRFFSSDLSGTGSHFIGTGNYLEAPHYYSGLIALLIFPQLFFLNNVDKALKIKILVITFIIFLMIVFPFFRRLFWAFTGDYYRTFSFFITLFISIVSAYTFHKIHLTNINKLVLVVSFIIYSGLILAVSFYFYSHLSSISIVVLVLLTTHFLYLYFSYNKKIIIYLALVVSILEILLLSNPSINLRDNLTTKDSQKRIGYNDYTIEAIEFIKSYDKSFYRIYKDYSSSLAIHRSLNDAKVFGYFGVDSYYNFNQLNYIEYLKAFDMISNRESDTRWAVFKPRLSQLSITGVKYIISKNKNLGKRIPELLEIYSSQGIFVYQNKAFVPLGYFIENTADSSTFKLLNTSKKDRIIFKAAFTNSSILEKDRLSLSQINIYTEQFILTTASKALQKNALSITDFDQNLITGKFNASNEGVIVFAIPADPGWKIFINNIEQESISVNFGMLGAHIAKGNNYIRIEYRPDYLIPGVSISILMLFVYIYLGLKINIKEKSS